LKSCLIFTKPRAETEGSGVNPIIEEDIKNLHNSLEDLRGKIEGKKFLVTGGAGFLGSWFCDVLDSFNADIICVDNISSGSPKNIEHLIGKKNFHFVNKGILEFELKEKVDYIVHMASIATPPLYMRFPIETLDTNITGTRNLLEVAKRDNISGFLFMSTSEVYGNPPNDQIPTKETFHGIVNSFGPRSMYDEGKRAAEAYCYSYYHQFKVPVRISRTFNVYGPRIDAETTSQYGRALIKFVYQAINNQDVTVHGDGTQTRSFCYITDQIEGLFRLLLTPGIDGEVFNIGNPKEMSINELAGLILNTTHSKSKIVLESQANYNLKDDPKRRCPDISKANKMFGYSPKIDIEDGLKRVAEWMRSK
jgi:UDP-glucuronate decarboxylase